MMKLFPAMPRLLPAVLCVLAAAAPARAQGSSAAQDSAAAQASAAARDSASARLLAAGTLPAPVVLGSDTLFAIETSLGPFTAQHRAAVLRERLLEIVRSPFADIGDLLIIEVEGRSDVMLGDMVLTAVTETDAAAAGLSRQELAQARAQAIRAALERTSLSTNVRALAAGLLYTLLASAALLLLLRMLNHVFPRVQRLIRMWQRSRLKSLRLQNLEVISAERIALVIGGVVTLLRVLVTVLLLYLYLLLVFSFFPWTRGVAARLVEYAVDPVIAVFQAFIAYVPHLFYIAVITITTYYVLKVIRLVFEGIASGALTLSGFYADWADTTYKIVRLLVLALAVILIWPHLPSSDRPEFRGVAAFLGLLLSLGSASAVANVIGGVVMVYMRPFQIGDRVKIADTVGDVMEKTLLVTRVRTAKNVDITIPNSMVLGSHIINYSSTAQYGGLVLHTTITLGYEVPWRKVHETLIAAATATDSILAEPAPFVLQTALNDYNVSYELNAYTSDPNSMARIYSELHQNIQDFCNEAGIEILSPLYAAHRDGSHTTIPQQHLAPDYEAPRFGVDVRSGG